MNVRMPPLATISADAGAGDGGEEIIELGPGETSLSFLQRVYRSPKQPMSRRLRAAIEAMPHEHPRLGAVAIGSMNGNDFAAMLEKAIERSGKAQAIEADYEVVDAEPLRPVPPRAPGASLIKRRSIP